MAAHASFEDLLRAMERIDPWGEWRNPQEHPEVLEAVVREACPYESAVGYVRALRPREDPVEAARWWASPEARAHFLLAILGRGERTLLQVEGELGLPRWKLHHYLDQFGFRFRLRPRRRVQVILPSGDTLDGTVQELLEEVPVRAVVETEEGWWEALWSRTSWAFRALRPAPPPKAGWGRLLQREPALALVDPATLGLYLGPEGYARLWGGRE